MTMLGKSNKWTSRGSSIPFLDTMILFGCSSTGRDRTRAATCNAARPVFSLQTETQIANENSLRTCKPDPILGCKATGQGVDSQTTKHDLECKHGLPWMRSLCRGMSLHCLSLCLGAHSLGSMSVSVKVRVSPACMLSAKGKGG